MNTLQIILEGCLKFHVLHEVKWSEFIKIILQSHTASAENSKLQLPFT